jgi:thiamine kinase-like enzyme
MGTAIRAVGEARLADVSDQDADARFFTAMRRIPALAGSGASFKAERIGGLTNINFLVSIASGRFVVRLPGDGTSEYINRQDESVAAQLAADVGVNAELVFFDATDGLMATRYVDGARTMSPTAFRDSSAIGRAASVFGRLHRSGARFASDFRLFPMIDEYRSLLAAKGAELPDGYDGVQLAAGEARVALATCPVELVACHCDPLCENFLDTGERMYLVDYEYAANNDPMWDLGDLSVEAGFTVEQDDDLLRAYFEGNVPADARARMVLYKALCDLLWTLWGVIQHVNGNPADDFWAYAVGRFERCRTLMASPEFANAVAGVAGGSDPGTVPTA